MTDVRPDPKPVTEGGIGRKKPDRGNRRRGRVTASRDGWLRLREAKLGNCRVCLCPDYIELHHLVPRSLGGDDVADNLVPLCRECHAAITTRSRLESWALASDLTDGEYAYVIDKLGEGALARLFGVVA